MSDALSFDGPDDAAIVTAELLIVAYVRDDGSNGYMVHARGDMPATTYLGLTVRAQKEIERWA
jgi:hypothetical protein